MLTVAFQANATDNRGVLDKAIIDLGIEDTALANGEVILNGDHSYYPDIKLCVRTNQGKIKSIKTKSIKQFRGETVASLKDGIVHCKNRASAADLLEKADLVSIVYYLNYSYNLELL